MVIGLAKKVLTDESFECPECGKSYKSRSGLNKHIKKHPSVVPNKDIELIEEVIEPVALARDPRITVNRIVPPQPSKQKGPLSFLVQGS